MFTHLASEKQVDRAKPTCSHKKSRVIHSIYYRRPDLQHTRIHQKQPTQARRCSLWLTSHMNGTNFLQIETEKTYVHRYTT